MTVPVTPIKFVVELLRCRHAGYILFAPDHTHDSSHPTGSLRLHVPLAALWGKVMMLLAVQPYPACECVMDGHTPVLRDIEAPILSHYFEAE